MAGGALLPPPHSTSANTHLPEIRVVVLGDARVGKTSLLRQYLDHISPSSSVDYEPTLLDSYTRIERCGKQSYRVHFTDCSSAPEFREHRAAYLAKCDVVILVFSALYPKTLANLSKWMREVVEARTSTGPARFASTAGDFSEVPIFVVGTSYGERHRSSTPAPSAVPFAEAEAVTTACLHSAGYFVDEEDADAEEGLRLQRTANAKKGSKPPKKKQSPRAFRGFFHDLFKGGEDGDEDDHHSLSKSKGGDKATKKPKRDEESREPHPRSPQSSSAAPSLGPQALSLERQPGAFEPYGDDGGFAAALPPGASARLPLYMLSNKDGEAVDTAVRASLALHLWLRQGDVSNEVSPGVTPLTSPRARSAATPAFSRMSAASGHGGPLSLVDVGSLTPQHHRTVSTTSHLSHVSERSGGGSFMPAMHALYGSVASLTGFEGSAHPSRGGSSAPLTEHNSPLAHGQPAGPLLFAAGAAASSDGCSPTTAGKVTTEPYASPASAHNRQDPLSGSPWCSPTVLAPGQVDAAGAAAGSTAAVSPLADATASPAPSARATTMPASKQASEPQTPLHLDATVNGVTPLPDEPLVAADTAIFVRSPPHPRRPTAPNTQLRQHVLDQLANRSPSTQYGEFSAFSGGPPLSEGGPSPGAATADTTAPRRNPSANDFDSRVWRDVDAGEHTVEKTHSGSGLVRKSDSVVKKLALENEGRSGPTSPPLTPQKTTVASAEGSPASQSPRHPASVSAPFADEPPSLESSAETSASTLRSPLVSPQKRPGSQSQSQSQSRTHSYASPTQPQLNARSQTRPPQRDEEEHAKSTRAASSEEASGRGHAKTAAPQKQKTKQCTTGGCSIM